MREDLSIIGLILEASFLVQCVLVVLLFTSLISWYLIDRKRSQIKRLTKIADDFENKFWSGGEMNKIYQYWSK
jgi:biopolymer transport protein TolQ